MNIIFVTNYIQRYLLTETNSRVKEILDLDTDEKRNLRHLTQEERKPCWLQMHEAQHE
jgi:hypothetical protein